jgi:uncharacterized protein DUF6504
MSRLYGEPVDVWVRDDGPASFAWRGRLYTVLRVLDHWVVSREWWRQAGTDVGEPSEHEFWRVEASGGRSAPPATYELRQDTTAGRWLLARVWD